MYKILADFYQTSFVVIGYKNSIPFKTYRSLLKQQWLKKLGSLTNSTVKYFTLQKNTNMLFVQSDFKFSVFKTRRGVLYIYSLLFTFVREASNPLRTENNIRKRRKKTSIVFFESSGAEENSQTLTTHFHRH